MPNFVQVYRSTDTNAPTLTGQVGSLITLLNKVLVDGYTTASITSITRSGGTATVTMASANLTLVTGNYITISGANETDYNGTFQITVTSSTTFTYAVANTPATPATGTLLYAKAGLGWTRPFAAGTNSQTYRSADNTSNQFYLQVIDNAATAGTGKEAQVFAAEVMSADQTVTSGRFPTAVQQASGLGWYKSSTADASTRIWTIIGDDRTFYYWCFNSSIGTSADRVRMYGFGHFISFKSGDAYNTFIVGEPSFNSASTPNGLGIYASTASTSQTATNSSWAARSYSQAGASTALNFIGAGNNVSPGSINTTFMSYPNLTDNGLYVMPVTVWEANTGPPLRGKLPGVWAPLFPAYTYFSAWDTFQVTNPTTLNLMGMVVCTAAGLNSGPGNYGLCFVDMFGPWT